MSDSLRFEETRFEVKTCTMGDRSVTYRAFEKIPYCTAPVDSIQRLNLFVPECYYRGESINGYELSTAPIYMPNTVGGYMEGPAMEPGIDRFNGKANTAFEALFHGYVVACAGIRGRNTGIESKEFFVGSEAKEEGVRSGRMVGRVPALIVDMKAAIRYLRHNKDVIPGNTDHIITNGTSAGGALSALTGATGNAKDYEPYLKEIGAADEKDDIFAASCYCPIHNLEHADAAYEWLFLGHDEYHKMKFERKGDQVVPTPVSGVQDESQRELSKLLAPLFPPYLNSLGLKDEDGSVLSLDENGEGSFKEFVKKWLLRSAEKELKTHDSGMRLKKLAVPGSAIDEQEYLTITDGSVTDLDWEKFVTKITRMKTTPAFDAVDLDSPENEEFGDAEVFARHFTEFSKEHDTAGGALADAEKIRLLNPTLFIGEADTAPHWRIRHGAFDRDTSLAIPVVLQTLLKNKGYDVDFALPWGLPHSGDYDLEEQFAWIDQICK